MLAWVRQELHRTFFNRSPRLAAAPTNVEQVDDIVTGTLVGTDPDGDPITYTVTPTTTKGGAVTIDGAGNFTYVAPVTWNGVDPLTDTFTVSVEDTGFHVHGFAGLFFGSGHSSTREVTISLVGGLAEVTETGSVSVPTTWKSPITRVGPGGTVTITQRFGTGTTADPFTTQILVQAPGRQPVTATAAGMVYGGGPLIAADGTVHLTTVTLTPGQPGINGFTVTTLQPGKPTMSWIQAGRPIGYPGLTGAGDFLLTTATGSGAPEDTHTMVTIIRNGERRDVLSIAGTAQDQAAVGANGTIALAATNASGGTTIGVLRPGSAAEYLDLEAAPQGPVTIADDGTIVFTTVGTAGFFARAASTTSVWVWRPGEQPVANAPTGTLAQVVAGSNGTVAYVTTTGSGTATDLVVTTVTVLRPGAPERVTTVTGTLVGSVVVGAEGTVAFHTYAGAGSPFISDMTVTIMRPGGTVETLTRITNRGYWIRPAIGTDGTVASMWGNDGMTIAVFRPGQAPIVETSPHGISIEPQVAADGTVAYAVTFAAPTGEQYTEVTVLRPGKPAERASTFGYGRGVAIADDGTVVTTSRVSSALSYVMLLRPNGQTVLAPAIGLISNPAQIGPDGVVYLPTDSGTGSLNVLIVHPSNRYVNLSLPGRLTNFTVGAHGAGTDFVTVTVDASGAVSYTIRHVFVATVAAAPQSV